VGGDAPGGGEEAPKVETGAPLEGGKDDEVEFQDIVEGHTGEYEHGHRHGGNCNATHDGCIERVPDD